jgi:hypothetical protein
MNDHERDCPGLPLTLAIMASLAALIAVPVALAVLVVHAKLPALRAALAALGQ